MARQYIDKMKRQYNDWLLETNNHKNMAITGEFKTFEPLYQYKEIMPEAKGELRTINDIIQETIRDCDILQTSYAITGYKLFDLIRNTSTNVSSLLEEVMAEYERLELFRYLISKYDKFNNIIDAYTQDLTGSFSMAGKYITAAFSSHNRVRYEVVDIDGNGYEGNENVYRNGEFLENVLNTANRKNISNSVNTNYYEYSRLFATSKLDKDFSLINYDNVPAKCNISITADKKVNSFSLNTFGEDIVLTDILISNNGVEYRSVLEDSIVLNSAGHEKHSSVHFPPSLHVKLSLQSTVITDDKIAIDFDGDVQKFNNVKRSLIRMNNLEFFNSTYARDGNYVSTPKQKVEASTVAIYANENIPQHFSSEKTYFEYLLTINGETHKVVPINSNRSGVKIIKTVDGALEQETVKVIKDKIKSVELKVLISTDKVEETPLLNNIKILTERTK